ncbi:ABC transporter ATP-binding protein [Thermoleptolyngbya sichuanensis A183]|uniref:ABC transporter ATP-binding protein n=1 Tax=Thermoleptolyngbya sichuanensis A183 TaxID=2737172 RepID=A0A6M8BCD2_9CYAN|nr:ABC transporter ATP-binding protein [Thermoleptolyngbya sichuanensis]QKD81970.1 ABC transporter ATP-binding protein [Thermoleptolyngbya sichuanensis A183]
MLLRLAKSAAESAPFFRADSTAIAPLLAAPQVATSPVATSPVATSPVATSPVAIALRDIDLVFRSEGEPFQALRHINLEIPRGSVQLIMGPAGAGKTTLLQVVAGLLSPTAGQVELLGTNLTQLSRAAQAHFRNRHLGIVFQDYNLLRSLTALENVELALNIKGVFGPSARTEARSLLDAVGLESRANVLPRQLSGGQQQRVAVARALVGRPDLIIADEPTSALDSANGRKVMELLCRLAREQGSTVLIATHDPRVREFGDAIAHLEDGQIQA